MKQEHISAETVFSQVLLEKLTSQGVIVNALDDHPSEHTFFAVVGIAFDRWKAANGFIETDNLFQSFFRRIDREKGRALSIISAQQANRSSCATPQ